jgi:hypothetical protein
LAACAAISALAIALGSAQASRPRQPVTVMSYNIFQGSELSHSLAAKTLPQLNIGAAKDYENVVRSNIPARAKALAAEIQANKPAVLGLQEAVLWRTRQPAGSQPVAIPGNATHVSYDFVQLLVRALAARGVHYRAVAITNNFDLQVTGHFTGGKKMDVRITDRVAILARRGAAVSNAQEHNFVAHTSVNVLGVPIAIRDGWASVDVKLGGRQFRFITTHLDGVNQPDANSVRAAEARELMNGPEHTKLPVVFTCDCNSTPGTQTHHELTAGGLRDSWAKVHPRVTGLTCCHRSSPTNPEVDVADPRPLQGIVERLDYVFSRSPFAVLAVNRVGLNPADRTRTTPRLWPSDHLGLVAQLTLP